MYSLQTPAAEKFARPAFARVAVPEVESLGGVFTMVEDHQGFLWFGGKNGLARYDGYQVQLFRHDPADSSSLSSNDISDLLVDREGRLWVATLSGGGLNRFDAASQTFVRYSYRPEDPYSLGSNAIYALAEDSRGDLWLATHDDGLNRLEHKTGRFHHYPRPVADLSDVSVRDIAIDRFDNVWAATNADGLYRIQAQGTETQHYRHDPTDEQSLGEDQLYSVYIDDYDNVWAGGWKNGLSRLDHETGRFTRFQHDPDRATSLGSGQVWDIAQDSAGNLWVATGNGALNRFNKWQNQFERFYPEEYVSNALSGAVVSFYLDEAGDLWLGTYNSAVNRVSDRGAQFKILRHNPADPNSLLSSVVYALAQTADGKLWIGTERGLSLLDPASGGIRHWRHDPKAPDSLPKAPIRALAVDAKDRLWLGTFGMGIWYLESGGQQFQRVRQNLLQDDRIWAISPDDNGRIWIGTQSAGLVVYNPEDETTRTYRHDPQRADSLSHDFVWTLLHDSRGDLWAGTQVGLNRLVSGAHGFQRYLHSPDRRQSLGDDSVRALAEDRDGNLWIGTPSSLNQWRADTGDFRVFRTSDGLADDNVTSVVVDDQGSVWSATQRGLARLDPAKGRFRNFDSRHGVAGNAHPRKSAALRGSDGTLYFAGASGVTVLNPFTVQTNLYQAPTTLTALWVNNQPVPLGDLLPRHISLVNRLELSHRQNVFALEFAHLSYLVPEQNQYAYQLVGFDQDWQVVGVQNYVEVVRDPKIWTFFLKTIVWTAVNIAFHVGLGLRAPHALWGRVLGAGLLVCDEVAWRDPESRSWAGRGRVAPDLAYREGAPTSALLEDGGHRLAQRSLDLRRVGLDPHLEAAEQAKLQVRHSATIRPWRPRMEPVTFHAKFTDGSPPLSLVAVTTGSTANGRIRRGVDQWCTIRQRA